MAQLNSPLGTTTPEIFLDNVKRADELVNGPAGTVNDRAGEPLDIEGVKLNGDVVSKNGGSGSVEPVPSVLESSAAAHWLFGYESTSYTSRVGYKMLTPQAAPEFNNNYISISAWGGALMTDIPDAGEYTVCAVVRVWGLKRCVN